MKNKNKIISKQSTNKNKLKSSTKNGGSKISNNKNESSGGGGGGGGGTSGGVNTDDKIWQDPRFSHLVRDPRFKHIHKQTKKTKIDKRFNLMFNDDKFKVTYTSDKYGRPIKKSSSEDLKKYYHVEEKDDEQSEDDDNNEEDNNEDAADDSDSAKEEEEEQKLEAAAVSKDDNENDKLKLAGDGDSGDDDDDDDDVKEIPTTLREKLKDLTIDYARGEGTLLTDDSSDDESSSDEDGESGDAGVFIEHVWGELDVDAPKTDESTRRLAVCNMDWDRIRSVDIMMLCHSFLPPGGVILSVTIYPSEYGKERMAIEEIKGPQELTEIKKKSIKFKSDIVDSDFDDDIDEDEDDETNKHDDSDDNESEIGDKPQITEEDEGDDFNMEKLRQYQLNRLKYYYAVIECNNIFTADKIYAECDGLEYESTATKLDLRFIPDDMTFDDEPKDQCNELPDMSKYKPRIFTTTALQQAKVELTWDENDVERKELNDKLMAGKLNEVDDYELKKYVAYSSEEEEDEAGSNVEGGDDDDGEDPEEDNEDEEANVENDDDEELESENKVEIKLNKKKKKSSIDKYKDLLNEINEKEKIKKNNQIEMEYSWGIGSTAKSTKSDIGIAENESDELPNNKNKKEITHFEKILEKKQEKKKARKEKQKKLRKKYKNGGNDDSDDDNDDDNSDDNDTNDSDESDMPDGIDMNDSYFAEEFANGEFQKPKTKKLTNKKKTNKNDLDEEATNELNKKEAELTLLLEDQQRPGGGVGGIVQNNKSHFSLKKIQEQENESKTKRRKKLKRTEREAEKKLLNMDDDFQINTADERFASVFNRHIFNIDQTNPNFKNTKGVEAFIKEKLKRKPNDDDVDGINDAAVVNKTNVKKLKKNIELNLLVNSIKRKVNKI